MCKNSLETNVLLKSADVTDSRRKKSISIYKNVWELVLYRTVFQWHENIKLIILYYFIKSEWTIIMLVDCEASSS